MELFNVKDQVCVITGSSRGIGKAIALRMAEAGAKVVISSRKAESCQAVADEIAAAGGEALVVPCNISNLSELDVLVDKTMEHYGRIDTLVCNAAANPVYGPMDQVEESAFDKIVDTNIKANLWLANKVLPQMKERKDGSIIIVSSIAGMAGSKNIGVYGISKAADFQIARNMAVEHGKDNIRINCIAPGLVKTDFARALWEDPKAKQYVEHMTPLGRMGDPDDIAGVAVFLASPAARFITGQSIVADGGALIRDMF